MNQLNKRLNLGLPENSWQNTAYQPVQVQPVAVDKDGTPIVQDTTNPGADPLQAPSTGEDTKPHAGEEVKPEPAQEVSPRERPRASMDESSRAATTLLAKKLQRFFYKQRVRQLKSLERGVTALEYVTEVTALNDYLQERGINTDCRELQRLVSKQVVVTTLQHYGKPQLVVDHVKDFYNRLDKAMPELAEALCAKGKVTNLLQ